MILGLMAYAFASSITPGPNNLMLMASGANFGLVRTIPHALGVALGFVIMCSIIGIALVPVIDAYPIIYTVMKVLSVAFLLWLAWKIANAAPPADAKQNTYQFWRTKGSARSIGQQARGLSPITSVARTNS